MTDKQKQALAKIEAAHQVMLDALRDLPMSMERDTAIVKLEACSVFAKKCVDTHGGKL